MKLNSLTQRIIITFVILLTLTSALFGVGLLLLKQKLEEATFGKMVKDQLHEVLAQPDAELLLNNPLFKGWQFYKGEDADALPPDIRQLAPGTYHSIKSADRYLHLEIERYQGEPVYMIYDVTDWEEQEHALLWALALGVLLVVIAGIILGAQSAKPILEPVRRLSRRLSDIQPGQRNIRIAEEFTTSEIGDIAVAVDGYLQRLDQFVEREQSFSAAASHELRTPLSVIMGAVDILQAHEKDPVSARAVSRIQRACADMHAFIEASLFLARESSSSISQHQTANITEIIENLIDDNATAIEQANIHLELSLESHLIVHQPKSILQIVIGNILRNAIEHSAGNRISITLKGDTLIIADSGEGIETDHLPRVFEASFTTKAGGTGLGLNLVKRICERFHWRLDITSIKGQGTEVQIVFN